MSDPTHLTDEGGDATELERELLLAAREAGLSAAEKRAIWAGVALQALPALPLSVAPGGAVAKVSLSLSPWLKGLLVVAGLGGLSAGIYRFVRAPAAPSAPTAVASAKGVAVQPNPGSAPAVNAPAALPSDAPSPAALEAASPPSTASAPNASRDVSPVESKSALREESLAVLEIRRTLRAGDANGALRLLEQARQHFPRGALSQEREALSIEALAKSGAHDAAARQADAFLRAHPKSPYAADVQSFNSK
jgi:hypothetical protein